MIKIEASAAMADHIVAQMRLQIVSGELADGQKLSENILAAQFSSSRAPIREALRVLEYEGLVELTKQGVVVRGLTEKALDELLDVRYMLELYCLTHLDNRTISQLADRLIMFVDRMELALMQKDFEEFAGQDIRFHNAAFEVLEHRFIKQFWENIRDLYQVVLYVGTQRRFERGEYEFKQLAVEKHRKLAGALKTGDATLIKQAIQGHFNRTSWIDKDVTIPY